MEFFKDFMKFFEYLFSKKILKKFRSKNVNEYLQNLMKKFFIKFHEGKRKCFVKFCGMMNLLMLKINFFMPHEKYYYQDKKLLLFIFAHLIISLRPLYGHLTNTTVGVEKNVSYYTAIKLIYWMWKFSLSLINS